MTPERTWRGSGHVMCPRVTWASPCPLGGVPREGVSVCECECVGVCVRERVSESESENVSARDVGLSLPSRGSAWFGI